MEKTKRQKVRWEFYKFAAVPGTPISQFNLKVENPCEIRFIHESTGGTFANINNVFTLSNLKDYISGVALMPYELVLTNNQDEIDVTSYSLQLTGGQCYVVCKYFINS